MAAHEQSLARVFNGSGVPQLANKGGGKGGGAKGSGKGKGGAPEVIIKYKPNPTLDGFTNAGKTVLIGTGGALVARIGAEVGRRIILYFGGEQADVRLLVPGLMVLWAWFLNPMIGGWVGLSQRSREMTKYGGWIGAGLNTMEEFFPDAAPSIIKKITSFGRSVDDTPVQVSTANALKSGAAAAVQSPAGAAVSAVATDTKTGERTVGMLTDKGEFYTLDGGASSGYSSSIESQFSDPAYAN